MLTLNEQRNLCLRYKYMIHQYPYSFKLFFFYSKIEASLRPMGYRFPNFKKCPLQLTTSGSRQTWPPGASKSSAAAGPQVPAA
jgi:hypothetical protein